MAYDPTPEQAAIVEAAKTGKDLVIEAGAGAGKTSTLKLIAAAMGRRRGLYIAYNKAIQVDAAASFPRNVRCSTSHALAFGAIGKNYAHRLNAPRVSANRAALILDIRSPLSVSKDRAALAPGQLARLAMETVAQYCYSADDEPHAGHVPPVNGLDDPVERAALAARIVPLARRAWEDLTDLRGELRFTPDVYLKMWALSRPSLRADVVFLDEAQDSNPCVAAVVNAQAGVQKILVGDSSQAIYGWRGARDAMRGFNGARLTLSQSFRFGPAIAAEANKWLTLLGAPLRLSGYEAIPSRLADLDAPDAVLCRSNAEAMRQVVTAKADGRTVALVGGGKEIRSLAKAAIELKETGSTAHPELMAFTSWGEVQTYVEEAADGSDLKVAVGLIDDHTPEGLIEIIDGLTEEDRAQVVVSTAHKAKGREWDTVLVADDFREPVATKDNPEPRISREAAMLAYVTVTRAKKVLDRSGLAWVDNWTGTGTADEEQPAAAAAPVSPAPPAPAPVRSTGEPARTVRQCPRCRMSSGCVCDPAEVAKWQRRRAGLVLTNVYVGPVQPSGFAHLMADTPSAAHRFAGRIGLPTDRLRLMDTPRWHYLLTAQERDRALAAGAAAVDVATLQRIVKVREQGAPARPGRSR